MSKIFEIPIYALDEKELRKRYKKVEQQKRKEIVGLCEEQIRSILELEYFPQRVWQYNHIIGFIVIAIEGNDLIFEMYKCQNFLTFRYHWNSHIKHFLVKETLTGYHFYLGNEVDNKEIQIKVACMLQNLIDNLVPKRWYVDKSKFDLVNPHLDYLGIYKDNKSLSNT